MNRGIVILICGLPGSGKSYFAARLAAETKALHLSSDRIRREIFAAGDNGADSGTELYSPRNKTAVYDEMLARMRAALSENENASASPVILDANFARAELREKFQYAAQAAGARFFIIQLVADEDTARRRIQRPRPDSDADFAVYLKLRDAFEAPDASCLKLESSDANIKRLLHRGLHYIYGAQLSSEDLDDLRRERAFADARNATAEMIETHISWVLLGKDRVYKIKKPARFSFLDFSTLMHRYHSCREEVRLNSRLSDIYLGVRAIRRDTKTGVPFFAGAGATGSSTPIIGFAVEMERLDNRYEMDRMLAENSFHPEHADRIARTLARFHREEAAVAGLAADGAMPAGDPALLQKEFADLESAYKGAREFLSQSGRKIFQIDGLETNTRSGDADSQSPADRIVARACEASREFLAAHANEIRRRRELGLVRDCHGDCHSRNIFLPPDREPVLFDCIEFSAEIRRIDLLNEIAFLCMDLDALGHGEMIEAFVESYLAAEPAPGVAATTLFQPQLFAYFLAYWANIRAKVALLRIAQCADDPERFDPASRELELYLKLMDDYVSRFAPTGALKYPN